jgi:hypothetical protein
MSPSKSNGVRGKRGEVTAINACRGATGKRESRDTSSGCTFCEVLLHLILAARIESAGRGARVTFGNGAKETIMRQSVLAFLIAVVAGFGGSIGVAEAQVPTKVLVRVTANDAKILGSGVGGARVTIRDALTGQVLAQGVQQGSTGNTGLIMGTRERGSTVYETDGAAGFLAELALSYPTQVLITGEGPLAAPQAMQVTSRSLLVIPGQDVLGEGVILELLGFTVELLSPEDGVDVPAGEPVEVRGKITMLCGCPTEPGGLWDANDYEVLVQATRGGEVVGSWPMEFAGETSHYAGTITLDQAGEVGLRMLAMDPGKGNFGMATTTVRVHE